MISVRTLKYYDIQDICEHFGKRVRDFHFTRYCDDGVFAYFPCDKDTLHGIQEELEDCEDEILYCERLRNDLMLINYFREELDVTDGVDIHVYW